MASNYEQHIDWCLLPSCNFVESSFPNQSKWDGKSYPTFPKGTDVTKHQEQTQAWKRLEVEIRHSRKMWAYVNNDFRNPARKPFEGTVVYPISCKVFSTMTGG